MNRELSTPNRPLTYFLLVILFSIPLYLLGFLAENALADIVKINLPISAFMAVCPLLAAVILTYRQQGGRGAIALLRRTFDFAKIRRPLWYAFALLTMPVIALLSYIIMRIANLPLPDPQTPLLSAIPYFFLFLIGAVAEELGWTGYALEPLQARWGALRAGIIIGVVWAAWHIIPYIQAGNPPGWIVWQCIYTVAARVLMVWMYNHSGKSVFTAVLFHIMLNLSWAMFPNYGSHFNPFVTGLITVLVALIVTLAWKPKQ